MGGAPLAADPNLCPPKQHAALDEHAPLLSDSPTRLAGDHAEVALLICTAQHSGCYA